MKAGDDAAYVHKPACVARISTVSVIFWWRFYNNERINGSKKKTKRRVILKHTYNFYGQSPCCSVFNENNERTNEHQIIFLV